MISKSKLIIALLLFQTSINNSCQLSRDDENKMQEINELESGTVIEDEKPEIKEGKNETITLKVNQTKSEQMKKNKTEEIRKLEKERGELFKQINVAIDESVALLKSTNDTEAKLGIKFMTELKHQIKEINETNLRMVIENVAQRRIFNDSDSDVSDEIETRKGFHYKKIEYLPPQHKKIKKRIKLSYAEIAALFNKKDTATLEEKRLNEIMIQKKLDDWLLQRKAERDKLKKEKAALYRNRGPRIKPEKCQRFGEGKKTITDMYGNKRKVYYPCCRKCCKKSYMGCL